MSDLVYTVETSRGTVVRSPTRPALNTIAEDQKSDAPLCIIGTGFVQFPAHYGTVRASDTQEPCGSFFLVSSLMYWPGMHLTQSDLRKILTFKCLDEATHTTGYTSVAMLHKETGIIVRKNLAATIDACIRFLATRGLSFQEIIFHEGTPEFVREIYGAGRQGPGVYASWPQVQFDGAVE